MKISTRNSLAKAFLAFLGCAIISCATVSTERVQEDYETADLTKPLPPYSGPKSRIQVVRFGIPEDVVSKYPELVEKRVGWGLSNRIVEGFYDTGRFEFVEEKETILNRIVEQWKLTQAGIYAEEKPFEAGGLKSPHYLVYAEVYDFSVSYSEVLAGLAMEKTNTTIIGIQVRLVDVATGKFIPAAGTGEAKSTAASIWANPDLPFDQTTVGLASQRALNVALRNLLERLEAQK
jgi:curli biogenesis system outer membrane secretion channel CsgG